MANVLNGWIILDKPTGITSAHAVGKVKRLLKPGKIGHAGTLDPLASGILPLALGEATKTMPHMVDTGKSYSFAVTWGEERSGDDCLGEVVQTSEKRPNRDEIEAILPQFTGKIQQIPPAFSAIKVAGQRAYDLARSGINPELKAREVLINSLKITNYQPEFAEFICHCGKGTYIRSLARDMGRVLGCLGHISRLRRLSVGKYSEKDAISLEVLEEMLHKGDLSFLRPVESALDDILAWDISSDQAALLRHGQTILIEDGTAQPDGTKVLVRCEGRVVAICEMSFGSMKPDRVFNL